MFWRLGLGLAVALAIGCAPAGAAEIEQQYGRAAAAFHGLNRASRATAAQWRQVAGDFAAIHRVAPQHPRGADALYSAGLAHLAAFRAGGSADDLADALKSFERFVTIYPGHRLADDSLIQAGGLLAKEFRKTQRAYLAYHRVLSDYPDGDQQQLARRLAEQLKQTRLLETPRPAAYRPPARQGEATAGEAGDRPMAFRPPADQGVAPGQGHSGAAFLPRLVSDGGTRPADNPQGAGRGVGENSQGLVPAATLKRLMFWSSERLTRVVLTLDDVVDFEPHRLPGAKEAPPRLYLDLKNTRPNREVPPEQTVGDGVLQKIRVHRHTADITRVVFDLQEMENFKLREFNLPFEKKIVVDLYRKQGAPKMAVAPPPARAAVSLARPSLQAALGLKVRTVVIDPGHGGKDPGAVAFSLQEKHVALEISQALAEVFRRERPEIRVELTRTGDTFIPLAERPVVAKKMGADLFISIHLNAHRQERFSGVETYFLNLTSDAAALRVAARENATSRKQVGDLNDILHDLLRDTNILESSKLANSLQATLVGELRGDWPVRDLGVKQAPFMVLIGAEMPSVLVEAGFLTNRRESKLLRKPAYLRRIAEGIYAGLRKYIREQPNGLDAPLTASAEPVRPS